MNATQNGISIPIFITEEQDCPYFKEKRSITAFVNPNFKLSDYHYQKLSELGFRRSGNDLYRPHCNQCQKCIATRINVDKFNLKRRFKRILTKNKDIKIKPVDTIDSEEHYQLYDDYINTRHADGSMYPASKEQYRQFLMCDWSDSQYFEFRLRDKLLAVAVTDEFPTALSAVYTFFSPQHQQRSLGIFAILSQLQQVKL